MMIEHATPIKAMTIAISKAGGRRYKRYYLEGVWIAHAAVPHPNATVSSVSLLITGAAKTDRIQIARRLQSCQQACLYGKNLACKCNSSADESPRDRCPPSSAMPGSTAAGSAPHDFAKPETRTQVRTAVRWRSRHLIQLRHLLAEDTRLSVVSGLFPRLVSSRNATCRPAASPAEAGLAPSGPPPV